MKKMIVTMALGMLAFASIASSDKGVAKTKQVLIPAGPYWRGITDFVARDIQVITLRAVLLDETEVTTAQYEACVKAGKCKTTKYIDEDEDDIPARGVTWYDADTYCKFAGRRLPTEAESEKAQFPDSLNRRETAIGVNRKVALGGDWLDKLGDGSLPSGIGR